MRMKLPGTSPPNVQKTYCTPSARFLVTSRTSRFTTILVEYVRVMGGGTFGACVSTAVSVPLMSESAAKVGVVRYARPAATAQMFFRAFIFIFDSGMRIVQSSDI